MSYQDLIVPLISGGLAGLSVDLVFFPLDTIKTRLQSKQGFLTAGGFRNIYAGVGPAALGSAPSAALFFCTYELVKRCLGHGVDERYLPLVHMLAATAGEVVSNILRVPFEVIKQRSQANAHMRPVHILRNTLQAEGVKGLYRGYLSTISREVPFSFIQYPIWEFLKTLVKERQGGSIEPWQGAVCGSIAGGVSAGLTTPLDVAKTRIMLAKSGDVETSMSIPRILFAIGKDRGVKGLFSGFLPRVCGMSIGGFIFLGAYEKVRYTLSDSNL